MNNVGREPGNLLLRPASLAYRWGAVAPPGQVMDTVPFRGTREVPSEVFSRNATIQ